MSNDRAGNFLLRTRNHTVSNRDPLSPCSSTNLPSFDIGGESTFFHRLWNSETSGWWACIYCLLKQSGNHRARIFDVVHLFKADLDPTCLSIERKVKQMWYKISETFTKNVILVAWSPLLTMNSIWSQNVTTIQFEKKVSNHFDRNRSASPSQVNPKRVAWLAVGFARE